MGAYSALPIIICWFNQNLAGHHRRAIGTGWQIGFGNIGGIIAVYIFLAKDKPRYTRGYSVSLGFAALCGLTCILYALACWRQNKQRAKMPRPVAGDEDVEEREKGDLAVSYRYYI